MRANDAGDDPEPDLRQAAARFRRALVSNPGFTHAMGNLGTVERVRAGANVDRGDDPSAAIAAGRELLARLPKDALSEHELGELALAEARWRAATGGEPGTAFAAARDHFDRSVALNAEDPRIFEARARAALAEASWLVARRQAAGEALARGLEEAARAHSMNPGLARAEAVEGALLHLQAATEPDLARRAALAGKAVERLEEALAANPLMEHRYRPELEGARRLARPDAPT
jgi:hypothetical protein